LHKNDMTVVEYPWGKG